VKDAARGKSRLAGHVHDVLRARLVRAMALDTVAATAASPEVSLVLVVTPDDEVAAALTGLTGAPVRRVAEPSAGVGDGLNGAIRAGLARAAAGGGTAAVTGEPDGRPGSGRATADVGLGPAQDEPGPAGVAVLLGDVPALRTADLTAALRAARAHPRAVVVDAEETGTTLLTARAGVSLEPRFGAGSAAAHRGLGHVDLGLPPGSSLRRDVDVPTDLEAVAALGVGPFTRRVLADLGVDTSPS